jgi:hypothetical protein
MSGMIINQGAEELRLEVEMQKTEVAAYQASVRILEMDYGRTPALLQMLGKWFGFGPATELEWTQFKLALTEKELARCQSQFELITAAGTALTQATRETMRTKMGRMIRENPPALAQHIVTAYQPLIEAEESIEKKH